MTTIYILFLLTKPPRVTHPIACSNPVKCDVRRGVVPRAPEHPRR